MEELESWGADVVLSLRSPTAGGSIARRVTSEAEAAGKILFFEFPVHPICSAGYTREDCVQFGRLVAHALFHVRQGDRVAVHCRAGCHRTGVAIYLMLRLSPCGHSETLRLMSEMRPVMHREFVLVTKKRNLVEKASVIGKDEVFIQEFSTATTRLQQPG